jgi:hypothetical protein
MSKRTRRAVEGGFCGRTRRQFLWEMGGGFVGVALAGLLEESFFAQQAAAADGLTKWTNPLAPKKPPLPAKAKSVIFLYMYGGPSHIDTFDYKPIFSERALGEYRHAYASRRPPGGVKGEADGAEAVVGNPDPPRAG